MKNFIFLFLVFFVVQTGFAQTVNIPDATLKDKLLNYSPSIDTNNDSEIQVSEAQAVTELDLQLTTSLEQISNTTGLEAFVNLTVLNLRGNLITSIDLTSFPSLEALNLNDNTINSLDLSQNTDLGILKINNNTLNAVDVSGLSDLDSLEVAENSLSSIDLSQNTNLVLANLSGNNLSNVDFSQNVDLINLNVSTNPLTSIDLSNNTNLSRLEIYYTNVPTIDVSNCPNLTYLNFFNNSNLLYVNLKNGNTSGILLGEGFYNTPNVEMVCVDDISSFDDWYYQQLQDIGATITTDCGFDPNQSNTISGTLTYDAGDGCEANSGYGFPNAIVQSENNGQSFGTITNQNGQYSLSVDQGANLTSVVSSFPSYFSVSPNSQTSNFTGYGNVDVSDFCLNHSSAVADLNVFIANYSPLKPYASGHYYEITVQNMGTETVTGQLNFTYDNTAFNFIDNFIPHPNSLSGGQASYTIYDLKPLKSQTIKVKLRKPASIDPLTVGDNYTFSAEITPLNSDVTPNNNTFDLVLPVVSSYDPNDKQVHEGDEITEEQADDYLHYTIRFQNTGTANAEKVVVTDTLSDNLDWNTLQIISFSDIYHVDITNGSKVDFVFNNIDLPFEDADEDGSKGYIAYKIKPKAGIQVGDVISGDADIFFDQNPPIITNDAITTVVNTLSVKNQELTDISLYPNPTTGIVNISTGKNTTLKNVSVFSISGKQILQQKASSTLDLSQLSSGVYFVKLSDAKGNQVVKRVVKE